MPRARRRPRAGRRHHQSLQLGHSGGPGTPCKGVNEKGIVEHFARVAEADIPIMVQDAPFSGVNLPVSLLVRPARASAVGYSNIETPGPAAKLRSLITADGSAPETVHQYARILTWILTERRTRLGLRGKNEKQITQEQCIPKKVYVLDIARMVLWLAADDSLLVAAPSFVVDGGWT